LALEDDSVVECSTLLCNVVLQDSTLDRRRWILDPVSGYTVKGTYHHLTMSNIPIQNGLFDAAWLKFVPLKVSVFVWRLLHNRLPTKDNLLRRRVLLHDDTICTGGMAARRPCLIYSFIVTSLVACGTLYISG
jgi:hypothetical protein